MTGSFLFVKPTNPEGKPGTAYSGSAPCYAYDIASWEWLLERVLRRSLLPLALSASDPEHYREILACHEDQYRVHRWTLSPHSLSTMGLDGFIKNANSGFYPFSAFLAPDMKTDSDVLRYDVLPLLPVSWESPMYGLHCERVSTCFSPQSLAMLAQALTSPTGDAVHIDYLPIYDYGAESPDFLPPDWSPSDMDAWDQTAESTETTAGTGKVENDVMSWRWRSTVERTEFENPGAPVFKCLTHVRVDDPATTVSLTDDSGATVSLEIPPTPYAFRRDTSEYGSVREERGTQVRVDRRATAYSVASVRYALTIPYITRDVDFGPATSYAAFDRTGKTSGDRYVGYLAKPPGVADKMPVRAGTAVPDVDWGGKPTWWHANGFPKGLESTLSKDLREQLSALLSVYQPAVPPFYVPLADITAFPKPGKTHAWPYNVGGFLPYYYPSRHLAQAVTPFDTSARMDVMTTTVHPVPYLYAKFTTKATRTETNIYKHTKTDEKPVTRTSTTTYAYTHTGATLDPITGTAGLDSPATHCSMSETARVLSETRTRTSGATFGNGSEYSQDIDNYDLNIAAACSSLTCLRTYPTSEDGHFFVGNKTEYRYMHQTTSSDAAPTSTDRIDVSGAEPSYDLDPKWLMFPEWILPWIESADLYAAVESRIQYYQVPSYTRERHTTTDDYDNGTYTHAGSGSGKGELTHKSRMRMVSLGTMDLGTGKFPELDVAKLLSEDIDPDPEALTVFFPKSRLTNTNTHGSTSSKVTTTTDSVVSRPKPTGGRSRAASYFVVVRWKFDQPSPPSVGSSPFKDLFKEFNEADTALEAKKHDIARLKSGLASAKWRLVDAEAELERALERRDDPESAEDSQTQEAERALEEAKAELLDAQAALADAQAEMDAAQEALQEATEAYAAAARDSERAVADARAEYSRSVDAAKAGYDAAKEAYEAATGPAKDALDAAREGYDTAVGAARDAVEAAERALDSAGDAAREAANTALSDYDSAVEAARGGLDAAQSAYDEAVSAAQTALEDAQADPDATQADLDAAQSAYDAAVADAQAGLDAAQSAYDSAVESAQAAMDAAIADAEAEYESAMADAQAAYDAAVADYDTAWDSAQADLDAAQSAYDSAVEAARGGLDAAQSAYDSAVEAAQTALDEATAGADGLLSAADETLADAATAHANAKAAWEEASYAEADAKALVDEAQARLDALKAELEEDAQAAVEKAQAAVDAEQGLVDGLQEAVGSAEAELPDLEARLESARDALRQTGASGVA